MYENEFSLRLSQLRNLKGVSARDMSLSIGQNPGYINNIESGKAMPSMSGFFYICEFLGVTPCEFFDFSSKSPADLNDIINDLKQLDQIQLFHIGAVIKDIKK